MGHAVRFLRSNVFLEPGIDAEDAHEGLDPSWDGRRKQYRRFGLVAAEQPTSPDPAHVSCAGVCQRQ